MNNPETYISHQLNISKTKEAHVFPRARRFYTEKTRYVSLNTVLQKHFIISLPQFLKGRLP